MNLRTWRAIRGYPQRIVAEKVGKSGAAISLWEKNGVKLYANRKLLKKMSKGKITDFTGFIKPEE